MNEISVTINGQTFIVPSNKYGELMSWLNMNCIKPGNILTSEQIQNPNQQLLFEN